MEITDIDPLQYGLLFERFLNPERISMPDIDIDFCMNRRGEVIQYVTEKYGREQVAQIITFNTLGARAAIKDVGRVLDMSFADVDRITKFVPNVLNISLADSSGTDSAAGARKDSRARSDECAAPEGLALLCSCRRRGDSRSAENLVPLCRTNRDELLPSTT
jgi:DNA polymerase-3 subunit alpha